MMNDLSHDGAFFSGVYSYRQPHFVIGAVIAAVCGGYGVYAAMIQASRGREIIAALSALFFGAAAWLIWGFVKGRVERIVVSRDGIHRNDTLIPWAEVEHIAGQRASRIFDRLQLAYVRRGFHSWEPLRTNHAMYRLEYERLIFALTESLGDKYPHLSIG